MSRPDPLARDGATPDDHDRPNRELDLYADAVAPSVDDPLLSENNLGLGNYRDKEMWQQVQAFENGLHADAAFERRLRNRANHVARRAVARRYWRLMQSPASDVEDRRDTWRDEFGVESESEFVARAADAVWEDPSAVAGALELDPDAGLEALREQARRRLADYDGFRAPMHRMIAVRHEASRSRNAQLLDNVFNRVKEMVRNDDGDAAKLGGDA